MLKKQEEADRIAKQFMKESILVTTQKGNDFVKSAIPDLKPTSVMKLLYRGSKDGWAARDFHRLCDNRGPTVTVVKSSAGRISGGFTTLSWTSNNSGYKSDANALVFSVDEEVMFPCIKHEYAVYNY